MLTIMGKHKEWRKLAKKARRKRIRSKLAKIRDDLQKKEEERLMMSPSYAAKEALEMAEQLALEEAERRERDELERKWEEEERRVRKETEFLQARAKKIEEEKRRKKLEHEEAMKRKEEEEKKKQELIADYIYKFASGQNCALPAEMLIPSETQPGKEVCPFFSKVAACRFWDTCSRNHIRPALSDTLIFPGFYSHYTISQTSQGEYDTDNALEYDDNETYSNFLEFYRDIRYEFESCGRLTRLLVCSNPEPHLRGNVYVSYASERETMAAYLKFNSRYYAGKQLSCQFATIPSWKSAICGLYFRKKCPKGNACNFLHVFKDPGPPFYEPKSKDFSHSPDVWRWSESPEREENKNNSNGSSRRNKRINERKRSESPDKKSSRSVRKYRSRSKERERGRSRKHRQNSSSDRRSSERRRSKSSERRRSKSSERRRSKSSERRRSRSSDRKLKEKRRNRSISNRRKRDSS